jgi:hypothetical protein
MGLGSGVLISALAFNLMDDTYRLFSRNLLIKCPPTVVPKGLTW